MKMTKDDWADIKHFHPSEFDSPDAPGSGELGMEKDFVQVLDTLRSYCGFPFTITSGFRSLSHNKEVGGVENSAHTNGYAADIAIRSSSQRFAVLSAVFEVGPGIYRIGIANTFIHLDMDPSLPKSVLWTY